MLNLKAPYLTIMKTFNAPKRTMNCLKFNGCSMIALISMGLLHQTAFAADIGLANDKAIDGAKEQPINEEMIDEFADEIENDKKKKTKPDVKNQNSISLGPIVEDGKIIYEPGFFEIFAPQTALDMVREIPGFSITATSGDRGLGNASQNVLINGKRISGKSNDAETVLGRLAVSQVIRFEILDGSSLSIAGLNGQVLNVVSEAKGLSGNFRWRTQFRERLPANLLDAELNVTTPLGKGELTLGINNNGAFRGGREGPEVVADANGNIVFTRESDVRFRSESPEISAAYNVTGDGGSVFNIGGSFNFNPTRRDDISPIISPNLSLINEVRENDEDQISFEINTDYEFDFIGARLKLIAFQRYENSINDNLFLQNFNDGSVDAGSQFNNITDEGESILRSELRWSSGKSDWQLSFEGAYNFLDRTSELLILDDNGIFQNELLVGASARVEELRGDTTLSYSRPLTSKVNLQAIFGAEISNISQDGVNGLSRSFVRPKGSLALSWRPNSQLNINARIERQVGQLNFGSFLASVDIGNNGNTNDSNPLLVPPQSWVGEIEINRTLGKSGSIQLTFEGETISDLVDQIALGPDSEAVGNVDGARRFNTALDSTFLLGNIIGWTGARLDLRGEYEISSVPDQVFDFRRSISRGLIFRYGAEFRYDIPGTVWAAGFEASDGRRNDNLRLDFSSFQANNGPFTTVFVENKDFYGLKVNLQVQNLFDQTEIRDEIFFADRRDGPISTTESFRGRSGLFYRFVVTGTF